MIRKIIDKIKRLFNNSKEKIESAEIWRNINKSNSKILNTILNEKIQNSQLDKKVAKIILNVYKNACTNNSTKPRSSKAILKRWKSSGIKCYRGVVSESESNKEAIGRHLYLVGKLFKEGQLPEEIDYKIIASIGADLYRSYNRTVFSGIVPQEFKDAALEIVKMAYDENEVNSKTL